MGLYATRSHLQDLCKVECVPAGRLLDLLAATETVGNDEGIGSRLARPRQQDALADPHRDIVMLRFEPERAGHATASGVEMLEIQSHPAQHKLLWLEFHDRFVMTMPLHDGLALQARHFESIAFALNELAQCQHRNRFAGKEISELIAKNRDA